MKKILFLIIAIIFFVFVFKIVTTRFYSLAGNRILPIKIFNQKFYVEVVSSGEKMQKGLGGREDLCQSCGMLFQFPEAGKYTFWMKDMEFPIDIIWISNNKIVHIEKNIQPDFTGILAPDGEADSVLELNAGMVDKLGLKMENNVRY